MRFIAAAAAVALLATCSVVNAQIDISPIVGQANNLLGSLVGLENNLIAPLTPFGRKLQQFPGSDSSLVKANALGSIFYAPGGLYNPALYGAAITGVQPSGRKLQTFLPGSGGVGPDGLPDPYGFIPAANLVASVLKGKFPGRKLQSADEEELKWDAESVHSALGFSRKLQQDQVAANTLGSIVYGGIQTIDAAKGLFGRKLQQIFDPTRTGYLGTGSKAVQDNAVLSIAGNPALLDDPLTIRQATLGFQQTEGRHLLSEQVKVDAAGSLISGNITPDNVRKAILGFNQGSQNRHLLSEQVKVDAAGSLISGNITPDNVRKAILGFNQGSQNRHLLSEQVKVDAAGSLISGNITPDNVRKAILGFNQGSQNRHLLSEQVKVDAAGSLISGNITPDNVRKAILGFNQGTQNRHL